MRYVSITDIMRETGLSRATVDRVLNARGHVHARTREAVEETLRRLRAPQANAAEPSPAADILLRVGQGMMSQLAAARDRDWPLSTLHDMAQCAETEMVATLRRLCDNVSRPLIVTAKNTPAIQDVLAAARRRGKFIVALVSDLAPESRDYHVGIDNRAAGQAAAFLIGRALGVRPTTAAVVVGDGAYRCHEDREIGFRTGLRANFPKVVVSGEAQGEDQAELTRTAVSQLLRSQPGLGAIYNVGGGNLGVARACRDLGRTRDILVVGHEVNAVTSPLLREGVMDFALATDPALLLSRAQARIRVGAQEHGPDSEWLDFAIYTGFNLPAFAATPHAADSDLDLAQPRIA